MNTSTLPMRMRVPAGALAVLCVMTGLVLIGCNGGGGHEPSKAQETTSPATFGAPDDAVGAMVTALRAHSKPQLLAVMGPGSEDIISSGDEVADRQRGQKFLTLYDQKHVLTAVGPDRKTLVVGNDDWPFPIPLVKRDDGWRFDSEAGREEIVNRRIGENELSVIQVCKAIADAQREYALRDPDGDGVQTYAQKFFSDPGKRNGLFWHTAEGEAPSPLGELVADAAAEGYTHRESGPAAYHGYFYRILQSEGPHAPDGAVDFVVNGHMTLGFAVVAWPAEYGNSGIMTFIMGPDGTVYQQNLGEETGQIASEMKTFDPDADWKKVE